MRFLFSTGSSAHYMSPPRLGDEQINCGPYMVNEEIAGKVLSLRTPSGEYDLAKVVGRLPAEQQPDALVCLVDASWVSVPTNLQVVRGPKILLVADTHHLKRPLGGMIDYIAAQRFDRIIFLYTRHHLELFRAAGVRNLYWFPGLTFPHGDAVVRAARREHREPRLALVGQVGGRHERRQRLAASLADNNFPLVITSGPQAEALEFYGSSQLGLNVSLNGDLNLRCFEVMASGAALLTDRLAPASGWQRLWSEGRELVTYASAGELLERARHYLDHPAEAQAVGAAAARWFDTLFNEKRRREAFLQLVTDGRPLPEFAEPTPPVRLQFFGGEVSRTRNALQVYEEIQRLHGRQETVAIVLDHNVPVEFEVLFQTLPRTAIVRVAAGQAYLGGTTPDLAVVSQVGVSPGLGAAARIWVWDAPPQGGMLPTGMDPTGFGRYPQCVGFFARVGLETVKGPEGWAAKGWGFLQSGDVHQALAAAQKAVAETPHSVEPYLILAQLALDTGGPDQAAAMLAEARSKSPQDPRVALLALSLRRGGDRHQLAHRCLERAWRAHDQGDWNEMLRSATIARQSGPALAEAHYVEGLAGVAAARFTGTWMIHGKALHALREATRLSPGRMEYWYQLGQALRRAGATVADAIAPLQEALRLDPDHFTGWFSLGIAHLTLDQAEAAESAFRQSLQRAPTDLLAMTWLGHTLKRQGRIEEAQRWYARALGGATVGPRAARAGRRRVVFVAQNSHSWPCMAATYAAFAADPAWETIVVALPWAHPSLEQSSRANEKNLIFAFLEQEKIPFVRFENFSLLTNSAELVFLQNPYDSTRPAGWTVAELVRAGHRLCYVPYAIEFGGTSEDVLYQFNMPLQRYGWAIFARSEAHRRLFAEHCDAGCQHVIATGHPKFDSLCAGQGVAPDAGLVAFAAGRPLVLWNPHFDVRLNGTRFGDGYSTFLRWRDFIPEEFARRQDLAFVIRPHPTFFSALEQRGTYTREEMSQFFLRCEQAGNIRLDRAPSYYPVLAAADALISDASSVLLEFGISGKPVCYLHNPDGPVAHADYELDLDYLRQHMSWATTEVQIRDFLDRVAAGAETGGAARIEELRRRMGVRPGGVGPEIKRVLEERLTAELGVDAQAV